MFLLRCGVVDCAVGLKLVDWEFWRWWDGLRGGIFRGFVSWIGGDSRETTV